MDMSFANQALSVEYLNGNRENIPLGVRRT
jgi:S-adenosylhomocysteine hydrolase